MNGHAFRAELTKIMPGYNWTVHRATKGADHITATGIQSSGSNRLSTLEVKRIELNGKVTYVARSAGHGTRARWMYESADGTLARALRGLQQHYEDMANTYRSLAARLQTGRAVATGQEGRAL